LSIGIIVNPASGKDIRRLVSHAMVVDNKEKLNIILRSVLGARALGTRDFLIMPDTFMIGQLILDKVREYDECSAHSRLLDMVVTSSVDDTIEAARQIEVSGAACAIVLGGDGTSRAASKMLKNTAILPISTGTNNVYPDFVEGTIAGLCAATVERSNDLERCCVRDKRIEIFINGQLKDIALVDAVVSAHAIAGARAIWNKEDIFCVVAARAHPQNIGFSSVVGCVHTVLVENDFGYAVVLSEEGSPILAPIAPGIVERMYAETPVRMELGEDFTYTAQQDCMIALDGEREVRVPKGQTAVFRIVRNGPSRVDVRRTMEFAQQEGFLH
jgi:predicted polyphosphate/ATP-dependent NAD kinase